MKTFLKKFLSVMMVLAMVVSLSTTYTKAETTKTITISANGAQSVANKTFKVYQIMKATKATTGDDFSYTINEAWLEDLKVITQKNNEAEILKYIEALQVGEVRLFAEALRGKVNGKEAVTPKNTTTTAQSVVIELEDYGYYLVVEDDAESGATSLCLLNSVTPNSTMTIKSDYPEVTKKVYEESYNQDDGYGEGYNDAADYDIGDKVPFEFISELPNMSGYENYTYTFHDKMSEGLDFDSSSVEVYINDTKLDSSKYTVNTNPGDGCTFEVTVEHLETYKENDKVVVKYKATLNENAVIGLPGNPNAVKLEYSSNPYDTSKKNETLWDNVVVFTFDTGINKVDNTEEHNKLAGAEFKLYKDADCTQEIKLTKKADYYVVSNDGEDTLTSTTDGLIVIKGLDSGTYYLKETKAPDGYDLLEHPITITITATYVERQNWTEMTEQPVLKDTITNELADDILKNLGYTFEGGNPSYIVQIEGGAANVVNVVNYTHGNLPETGGMGNYIFYAGGLLLAGIAVAYFVKNRKEEF